MTDSIRSCDVESSDNSMASPVSAHKTQLTPSSMNSLATDRELFIVAASVVPQLRSVLEHRKDMFRSSNVWHTPLMSRQQQQSPCWVLNKKYYGVRISEFDRAKLPFMRHIDSSNWFRGSSRIADARHSMIESRDSIYTCDAYLGDHTQSEIRAQELLQWPLNDGNVTYAVSAQVTLKCRLNEAMTMLFSRETLQFDASMSALFGARHYKSGDLFVSRDFCKDRATEDENATLSCLDDKDLNDRLQPGWVSLQSVALRARRSLNPMTAAKQTSRRHRLCFAAYSQLCPDSNEAFYTMKTLPQSMHDNLTGHRDPCTLEQAMQGDRDHIAAGYHLLSTYSDLSGHQTRIVMTAYVYKPQAPDASRTFSKFWATDQPTNGPSVPIRRHYARPTASTEAKYVVNLLATATTSFEQLVRRRRLGCRPFLQTPLSHNPTQGRQCSVCLKPFGLLRSQRFCQLCAQHVCRECSRKFDVEPVARRVRRNRICFACVASVDASVFKQKNPLLNASFSKVFIDECSKSTTEQESGAANATIATAFDNSLLAPPNSSRESLSTEEGSTSHTGYKTPMHSLDRRSSATTTPSTSFSSSSGRQLADALSSSNPLTRARALKTVRQVVKQVTSGSPSSGSATLETPVSLYSSQCPDREMVNKYLEARLHLSNISVSEDATSENQSEDISRTQSFCFDDVHDGTQRRRCHTSGQCFPYSTSAESPVVPRPWATTTNLEMELDLDDDRDSAALGSICEVAAIRMRCSMAYIVAFNGAHCSQAQRVVGSFGAPSDWKDEATVCPFSLVEKGKPFLIKEPARDPQLRYLRLVRDIGVRFFAGFPIKSPDGTVVACLCTVDATARDKISRDDVKAMHALSKLATDLFEEEVNPYTPRH